MPRNQNQNSQQLAESIRNQVRRALGNEMGQDQGNQRGQDQNRQGEGQFSDDVIDKVSALIVENKLGTIRHLQKTIGGNGGRQRDNESQELGRVFDQVDDHLHNLELLGEEFGIDMPKGRRRDTDQPSSQAGRQNQGQGGSRPDHGQGDVTNPQTDGRLKENQTQQAAAGKSMGGQRGGAVTGHGKGAMNDPENDGRRTSDNRGGRQTR